MKSRKSNTLLLICTVVGIALPLTLYLLSNQPNRSRNGFKRKLPLRILNVRDILDLRVDSYYVAGFNVGKIYLGNYVAPLHMLSSNFALNDTAHLRLRVKTNDNIGLETVTVSVDSEKVYIFDRVTTLLLEGGLKTPIVSKGRLDYIQCSLGIPLSPSSAILRTIDTVSGTHILIKKQIDDPAHERRYLFSGQKNDYLFYIDGMLHYSRSLNRLIYLMYYKNQFIILDTNLVVKDIYRTIDTNRVAKIKIAELSSEKANTLSAPPNIVNRKSSIGGNRLFVQSNLVADNEDKSIFNTYELIDIYSIADGSYQSSIYLPRYKGLKISRFSIYNNLIFAIYGRYLLTFHL